MRAHYKGSLGYIHVGIQKSQASFQIPQGKKPNTLLLKTEHKGLGSKRWVASDIKISQLTEETRHSQGGKNLHKPGHSKGSLCV